MNRRDTVLRLTLAGPDRFPTVTLALPCGVAAAVRAEGALPLPGGCAEAMVLEGERLAHVPERLRRAQLRQARNLLRPGGTLAVAVGPEDDQYPRDALERAAWSCGFAAYVRYVAGRAVLTVPRREAPPEPLVSVLIPAYKPAHFAAALDSVLAQTWPRLEIVVGDDSPGPEISQAVAAARPRLRPGQELRLIRHARNLGGRANYLLLFAEARGQYVKYLNDDDLLAPDCVERMAHVLARHPQVTLVTSYRRLIDIDGAPLPDAVFNAPVLDHDGIVDGRHLATRVLANRVNVVGEPSTTMFRKADAEDNLPHLMSYAGRSARRNGDLFIWTMLMSRGDVAWLAAPLSAFRQHAGQVQHSEVFLQQAQLAWVELVADARDTGLIAPAFTGIVAAPLAPDADAGGLVDAAEAAHATGAAAEADTALRLALAADPIHARARTDLACLAWDAGRRDEAVLGGMLALCCPGADALVAANLQDMLAALGRGDQVRAVAEAFGAGKGARAHT
ncbi:MAG: glycosyltransferase [Rhodospirillales bacterium]|nr:glycosyltransferase [Rhodospirillales bacterium]